eukprot:CAMPEP_0170364964 /NCGR_PEP_ID=MMETSP0117_2-20130122/5654_1 /TAXON_ID=400756 /ORGANISM="Durinskia baltica, Strain CSIRO CS-38" /LENGTH=248 /DNA_ID=CAMNT_0010619499 /DNA_START=353 /DNA_END=1096 /DNA_ORIENTATION=+
MSVIVGQDAHLCGAHNSAISQTFRGSNDLLTQMGDDACSCDIVHNTRSTVSQRESYHWHPTSCHLLRWDSSQFCDLLGSRKMLLVGDSTMEQVTATLMSMITSGKGGCAEQVVYGRSVYLAFNHDKLDNNLRELVTALKPDICVINTGAHLGDLGDLYSILQTIKPYLLEFRATQNVTFVWKTQSPGHPDCDKATAPLSQLPMQEQKWYQWDLFPEFDRVAKAYAAELSMPVMDMTPLRLRPDAHIGW